MPVESDLCFYTLLGPPVSFPVFCAIWVVIIHRFFPLVLLFLFHFVICINILSSYNVSSGDFIVPALLVFVQGHPDKAQVENGSAYPVTYCLP